MIRNGLSRNRAIPVNQIKARIVPYLAADGGRLSAPNWGVKVAMRTNLVRHSDTE